MISFDSADYDIISLFTPVFAIFFPFARCIQDPITPTIQPVAGAHFAKTATPSGVPKRYFHRPKNEGNSSRAYVHN